MSKAAPKLKVKHGEEFYEPWMDYKEDLRRMSTITGTTSPDASIHQGRYRFANEYAESVSKDSSVGSSASRRPPPVIRTPTSKEANKPLSSTQTPTFKGSHDSLPVVPQARTPKKSGDSRRSATRSASVQSVRRTPPPAYSAIDYTKDKNLIANIKVEFKAFYAWTTNGREDDMTQEHIEKLLFGDM